MAKMYHPNYERHRDRPTRITFLPEKLDGKPVATADVPPEHVKDLLDRGYKPWPTGQGEQAVATVPDPGQLAAALEGANAPDGGAPQGAQEGQEGQQQPSGTEGTQDPPEGAGGQQGDAGGQQEAPTGQGEQAVADPRPTEASSVAEIRAYADRHGITLPNRGNKQELLQRIDQATPDT